MFERFTELSRRAIFFARFEASRYGSAQIDTEHLLLGLLREVNKVGLYIPFSGEWFRAEIEKRIAIGPHLPTSAEIPLSNDSKRALNFAIEEADEAQSKQVAHQHLLLGILRVEDSMAAQLLRARGVTLEEVRSKAAELSNFAGESAAQDAEAQRGIEISTLAGGVLQALESFLEGLKAHPPSAAKFFDRRSQFIDLQGRRWVGPEINAHAHELFSPYSTARASYRVENKRILTRDLVATILWQTTAVSSSPHHRMTVVMARKVEESVVVSVQLTSVEFQ